MDYCFEIAKRKIFGLPTRLNALHGVTNRHSLDIIAQYGEGMDYEISKLAYARLFNLGFINEKNLFQMLNGFDVRVARIASDLIPLTWRGGNAPVLHINALRKIVGVVGGCPLLRASAMFSLSCAGIATDKFLHHIGKGNDHVLRVGALKAMLNCRITYDYKLVLTDSDFSSQMKTEAMLSMVRHGYLESLAEIARSQLNVFAMYGLVLADALNYYSLFADILLENLHELPSTLPFLTGSMQDSINCLLQAKIPARMKTHLIESIDAVPASIIDSIGMFVVSDDQSLRDAATYALGRSAEPRAATYLMQSKSSMEIRTTVAGLIDHTEVAGLIISWICSSDKNKVIKGDVLCHLGYGEIGRRILLETALRQGEWGRQALSKLAGHSTDDMYIYRLAKDNGYCNDPANIPEFVNVSNSEIARDLLTRP